MKTFAGIFGGLMLSILAMCLATITFAVSALEPTGTPPGIWAFIIAWVVGFIIALKAPSPSKAWRRLMLSCAVLSFLLPISGIIFTGSVMVTQSNGSGAAAAGAAIGGGLISGALGFLGFFLGIAFLVVGLLVGRENKVVYVRMVEGGSAPQPRMAATPSAPSRPVMPPNRTPSVATPPDMSATWDESSDEPDLQAALAALRRPKAPT